MSGFVIKTFVSLDDVRDMCELDKAVFSDNNLIPFEIVKTWYEKNPRIYTAIFNGSELIGYINFMPITDECYSRFVTGEKIELGINPDDILVMNPKGSYKCLFSSVVVKEEYQNTDAFFLLLSAFYKNMRHFMEENDVKITSIIADCVNPKMEQFVRDSGFKELLKKDDLNIYEGNIF